MALPVDLTAGWASIILQQSPNGISGTNSMLEKFGVISAVIPTVRPELEAGQSIMFKVHDNTTTVIYDNDTYYLIEEKDIVFIEQEVTPP